MRLLLSILIAGLIFTGCSKPMVQIDWVDFLKLNDITYDTIYNGRGSLTQKNLGSEIGQVSFNVSENVHDPDYKVKNGDAAYLPRGTKIFQIKGYSPDFRVAAQEKNGFTIYEVDNNPQAKKGEDMLDIRDKVVNIEILSENDGATVLGKITNPSEVKELIDMVLSSNIKQNDNYPTGPRYFIKFNLIDKTSTNRAYWINSGELNRGIMLAKEFGKSIEQAVKKQ